MCYVFRMINKVERTNYVQRHNFTNSKKKEKKTFRKKHTQLSSTIYNFRDV